MIFMSSKNPKKGVDLSDFGEMFLNDKMHIVFFFSKKNSLLTIIGMNDDCISCYGGNILQICFIKIIK